MSLKLIAKNDTLWLSLKKELEDKLEVERNFLEQAEKPEDMYRRQGSIKLLKEFLKTKDNLK